ncbi:uncharacterized protein ACN427_000894 [Glossina fuscipes fuscipes]
MKKSLIFRLTKQSTKHRNQSENVVNQVNNVKSTATTISDRLSPSFPRPPPQPQAQQAPQALPSPQQSRPPLPQSFKCPLICSTCERKYQTLSTLRRHLRSECNQPKKFVCRICQRGFHHNFKLSDHYRRIHGIKNESKLRYDNL